METSMTFDQAIKDSADCNKRHLLLGNGFSIDCRPNIFTYNSLFEQADFSTASELPKVFEALNTRDFEQVIKFLESASQAITVYGMDLQSIATRMAGHAANLKELLVKTVASNHPGIPSEIDDGQFQKCRQFLANFLGNNTKGKVYTLNYDLLLYWALMQDDPIDKPIALEPNDGFGYEDADSEFITWMGESSAYARRQRVHYLHGALHLFDVGAELEKYTWSNTGRPLIEQAQVAINEDKFPLFVAEGDSNQKLTKIKHSAYLYHSFKSFSEQMNQPNDALFIFGHSLAESDRHILDKIVQGRFKKLYVSLYGNPDSDNNKILIENAESLYRSRSEQNPLKVVFYDSQSANIW